MKNTNAQFAHWKPIFLQHSHGLEGRVQDFPWEGMLTVREEAPTYYIWTKFPKYSEELK